MLFRYILAPAPTLLELEYCTVVNQLQYNIQGLRGCKLWCWSGPIGRPLAGLYKCIPKQHYLPTFTVVEAHSEYRIVVYLETCGPGCENML